MSPAADFDCQGTSVLVRNTFLHFSEPEGCGGDHGTASEQPSLVRAKTEPFVKLADSAVEETLSSTDDATEGHSVSEDDEFDASLPHSVTHDGFEEEWQPPVQHCVTRDWLESPMALQHAPETLGEAAPFLTAGIWEVASSDLGANALHASSAQSEWRRTSQGACMQARLVMEPTVFQGAGQVPPSPAGSLAFALAPLSSQAVPFVSSGASPWSVEAGLAGTMCGGRAAERPPHNTAGEQTEAAGACRADETLGRAAGARSQSRRTTVMLRNLPNNYTREALLEMIDSEGFAGRYDFLYFPIDFRTHAALGYAFLNLLAPEDADEFRERMDGFSRWSIPTSKVCHVGWSHPHQGLESHIARYRNSPLMHGSVPDAYRPVLFCRGVRIAFPAPTKKVKPPRKGTERMLV